ncbi:MAG: hypothetical protein ACKO2C_07325 [Actinomycetes bacterium]
MGIIHRVRAAATAVAFSMLVGSAGVLALANPAGATITTANGAWAMAQVACAPFGVSGTPFTAHPKQVNVQVNVTPEKGKTSQYVTGRAYIYRRSNGLSMTTGFAPSALATSTLAARLWFDFDVKNIAWVTASDFEVYVQLGHWTGSSWRYSGWYSANQLAGVPLRDSYGYTQSSTAPYRQYPINDPFATAWNWSRTCTA